jgi:hypothetical protein
VAPLRFVGATVPSHCHAEQAEVGVVNSLGSKQSEEGEKV